MLFRYAARRAAAMKARQKVGATVTSSHLLAPTGTVAPRLLDSLGATTSADAGSIDRGIRFASSIAPASTTSLRPFSSLPISTFGLAGDTSRLRYSGAFPRHIQSREFSSPPGQQPWVNPQAQVPGQNLEQYGVDLTKMAKEGKLDPVIGRRK